jgi:hypothetical protein
MHERIFQNMRRVSALLLVATTAALVVSIGALSAQASPQSTAEDQPSTVEDYTYPGADTILANYGVVLISGDGHILFSDCATPPTGPLGLIKVRTTDSLGPDEDRLVCFAVTGTTGHLKLKVPAVYEIRGDGPTPGTGHKLQAQLTTDAGVHTTVDVNPSGSTQVGVGASPGNAPTTLLQLDVTP